MTSDPRALFAEAQVSFARGDLLGARARIAKVLRRVPTFPPALHLSALVEHAAGAHDRALSILTPLVERFPDEPDGWFNLGTIAEAAGRRDEAERAYRRVIAIDPRAIPARGSLALLLEKGGRLEEAARELEALLEVAPKDALVLKLLAKTLRRLGRFEAEVGVAKRLLALEPGSEAVRRALGRAYFLWYDSVDRDPVRARAVLDEWLRFDPSDPVAAHMRAALSGEAVPERASDAYVARHFDEFSETFDAVLAKLAYRAPEHCRDAYARVAAAPAGALRVVDLGCGTGLCGPLFRPWAAHLVGVDLSAGMIDVARARGGYDALEVAELVAWLAAAPERFDLAVCADTLNYFGALEGPLRGVAGRLAPGGRFVATIEIAPGDVADGFRIAASGRYVHRVDHVRRLLADAGLAIEHEEEVVLRMEYGSPVGGLVFVARAG